MSGNPWNQTFSGKVFDLVNPDPESVSIKDIAVALANQCRFNGHTRRFYSVAEHCLYVSRAVSGISREMAYYGLMHDAAEAYVGDVVAPLKSLLPEYRAVEERVWRAICVRFNLPVELPGAVHIADKCMLATELEYLLLAPPKPWDNRCEPFPLREIGLDSISQFGLPPREAHRRFLERFAELAA